MNLREQMKTHKRVSRQNRYEEIRTETKNK